MAILKKDLEDFDSLSFSHGFHADITQGDTFNVELDVDDVFLDVLFIEKRGTAVHFGLDTEGKPRQSRSGHLKATITMPDLKALAVSSGGHASLNGFDFDHNFAVSVSGGGHITGDMHCGDLAADISGGSRMEMAGVGDDIKLNASGGAKVELSAFAAENAMVNASGGSKVYLNIDGKLYANASGGSKIIYQGEASVSGVSTSGGSKVTRASVKV